MIDPTLPHESKIRRRGATVRTRCAFLVMLLWSVSVSAGDGPQGSLEDSPSRLSDEPIPLQVDQVPTRTAPIFELGDPFLGFGPISRGWNLPTGATWNPSLQLYGGFRSAAQIFDARNQRTSEWANRLDLFANLSLTATERLLVAVRPLDKDGQFTSYQFVPDEDDGWQEELDAEIELLFFEGDFGEIFPDLDRDDSGLLDFGFSVGRQLIQVQDGMLMNDIVDSAGLVRNSLRPAGFSNLRVTGLAAWNDIHRGNNLEDESATIVALLSEADIGKSTVAVDLLYTFSDGTDGDGAYLGVSSTQRIGEYNTAFRAMGSYAVDGDSPSVDSGALIFGEVSWTPHGTIDVTYFNAFAGVEQFTSAARGPDAGGPLGRVGILFEAVGLGRYGAALGNDLSETFGAALGRQWIVADARRQWILEAGFRSDFRGDETATAAVAGRLQQAIGSRFIVQMDLFGRIEEGREDGYGARFEFRIKF